MGVGFIVAISISVLSKILFALLTKTYRQQFDFVNLAVKVLFQYDVENNTFHEAITDWRKLTNLTPEFKRDFQAVLTNHNITLKPIGKGLEVKDSGESATGGGEGDYTKALEIFANNFVGKVYQTVQPGEHYIEPIKYWLQKYFVNWERISINGIDVNIDKTPIMPILKRLSPIHVENKGGWYTCGAPIYHIHTWKEPWLKLADDNELVMADLLEIEIALNTKHIDGVKATIDEANKTGEIYNVEKERSQKDIAEKKVEVGKHNKLMLVGGLSAATLVVLGLARKH